MDQPGNHATETGEELQMLRARLAELEHAEAGRQRAEEALRQRTRDLGERVKELSCIYRISDLVGRTGCSIEQIIEEAVAILPPAWQYPDITCARLCFRGGEFKTGNFRETRWKQTCDILVGGEPAGFVEVCYLEERPNRDEGPFLREERSLLNGVAERLGRIVERSDNEKEKAQLEAQLHQVHKLEAVGQLAGGMAHDFNNLVTVIAGAAGVLKDRVGQDRGVLKAVTMIEQAVQQAMDMTRSLLTFGRKVPTRRERVNLGDTVRQAARLLERTLPSSVDLVLDVDGEPALFVMADPVQLQQAVLNLAINARDAMPNGGKLAITVRSANVDASAEVQPSGPATVARLTISDSGSGIRPELQPRIFEPFFTTKARGQGTGLGLSIVHGIVKAHGGSITVESAVDEGSTFTVMLPVVTAAPTTDSPHPVATASAGNGEMVVLAEEHWYVREIMAATLESLGYNVVQVTDGIALLECCVERESEIDLLVLDVDLPDRNGLECLHELRMRGIDSPAICTFNEASPDRHDHLPANTVALHQPFEMSELGRQVGELLAARHQGEPG